jgi:hypothetical protein
MGKEGVVVSAGGIQEQAAFGRGCGGLGEGGHQSCGNQVVQSAPRVHSLHVTMCAIVRTGSPEFHGPFS